MRRSEIDTLRGLACVLLVAFHVVGHSPATGLRLPLDHWASLTNEWLSILRMPLFSFLSGYVYALRPVDRLHGDFVRGKVRRLLVPMLLVGTTFAVLQALAPGSTERVTNWSLLHVVPVAHYWFLESLFVIFMTVGLLEWAGMLRTPARFAGVAACAAALHMTAPVPVYFGLEGATYLFPFFLLGIAALRFRHALERPTALHAAAVTLGVIALTWRSTVPISLADPLAPLVLLSSLCLCVLLFRWRPSVRWLAWVGSFSFGIYLFHSFFAAAARLLLGRLGANSLMLLFVAGLVAGIGGAILLTAVLRRVPAGHWVIGERSVRRRIRPPPSPARAEGAIVPGGTVSS